MSKIGLTVSVYDRPATFDSLVDGIHDHLRGLVDQIVVVDDHGLAQRIHAKSIARLCTRFPDVRYIRHDENLGVAAAKNTGFAALLDGGCDYIFAADDDVLVLNYRAITGYVHAMECSGYGHLGVHNGAEVSCSDTSMDTTTHESVTSWPNLHGSWLVYRRDVLEDCGPMDPEFRNTWGHVEHSISISLAGHCTESHRQGLDATGSEQWIRHSEVLSSIQSLENGNAEWREAMEQAKEYWANAHPQTFYEAFIRPMKKGVHPLTDEAIAEGRARALAFQDVALVDMEAWLRDG